MESKAYWTILKKNLQSLDPEPVLLFRIRPVPAPLLRIFVSFVIVTTVLLLVAVLREPECHRGE
jgi:hypothetical protein